MRFQVARSMVLVWMLGLVLLVFPGQCWSQAPVTADQLPQVGQLPQYGNGGAVLIQLPAIYYPPQQQQIQLQPYQQQPSQLPQVQQPVTIQPIQPDLAFAARLYFHSHYRTRSGLLGFGVLPSTVITPRCANDPALQLWERFLENTYKAQQQPTQLPQVYR